MKENDVQIPLNTQLAEFGKTVMALFIDSVNLIKTESKLAKKSLKRIVWLFLAFFMLGLCSWLCCLGAIFSALAACGMKASANFALLALVNGLLMVGINYLLHYYRKHLRFNETRQLFHLREKHHESLRKEAQNVQNAR